MRFQSVSVRIKHRARYLSVRIKHRARYLSVRIKHRARCFETLWILTPIEGRKCNYTGTRKYDFDCKQKY